MRHYLRKRRKERNYRQTEASCSEMPSMEHRFQFGIARLARTSACLVANRDQRRRNVPRVHRTPSAAEACAGTKRPRKGNSGLRDVHDTK
ncbi:hypothetical protein HMPREF0762_00095 [Slackia exigua ATCC 700122]|uniref:Uncharacterized protein n=1 Tax=Slackia exigua (strain ATCC 700122 / DSM 15923 / CIP 105133 / JCM 11022 / KCTC 5966 / S-7) TaxID=649764 RepID=D0WE70_SLAES|nr:hypothetical protein HMPREF0762_00095 [Slackia exigua ATCC 700122]